MARTKVEITTVGGGLLVIGLFLTAVVSYARHVIWSIFLLADPNTVATTGQYILAGIGLVVPPVGMLHGFLLLIGAF